MDYLEFYKLRAEPFRNELNALFYFESKEHARTRLRIERAVTQRKGLAVLIGEAGCGKTTLAYNIEESLHGPELLVRRVSIPSSDCTGGWLLAKIASEFGVPKPNPDPLHSLEQIRERFIQIHEEERHSVLLLDEAQMLQEPARMEELRALLNLERGDGRRIVTVVLFGLPELAQTIDLDVSLAQRVEIRQELTGMDHGDVMAYLEHRLRCVGGSLSVFSNDAIDVLAAAAGGIPRVINTLADNALFEGALAERMPVDGALILAACEPLGIEPPSALELAAVAEVAAFSEVDEPDTQIDIKPPESATAWASEPEPEPALEPEPELQAEPEPEAEPVWASEPEPEFESDPEPELEAEAEPDFESLPEPEPEPEREPDWNDEPGWTSQPDLEADLEAVADAEPEEDSDVEPEPEPDWVSEPEEASEPEVGEPEELSAEPEAIEAADLGESGFKTQALEVPAQDGEADDIELVFDSVVEASVEESEASDDSEEELDICLGDDEEEVIDLDAAAEDDVPALAGESGAQEADEPCLGIDEEESEEEEPLLGAEEVSSEVEADEDDDDFEDLLADFDLDDEGDSPHANGEAAANGEASAKPNGEAAAAGESEPDSDEPPEIEIVQDEDDDESLQVVDSLFDDILA